ncbi:MAG: thioredoxin-dependent thiol peroxidase [Verrucomicrobiota bacterium]|mgnify:CR=1 FL=1
MPSIEPLAEGASAPTFDFVSKEGVSGNTQELAGKAFLIYFYPKDDTPGCTKEACAFRDAYEDFRLVDVPIIGVSGDTQSSHDKFRKKFQLPFPLASDSSTFEIAKAFGVYGEKKFMGKVYEGIHRVSFLIGPNGDILKTYRKVKPDLHAQEVLMDIKELNSTQSHV